MRIIVHTGKGGVGKTSISAATAVRCAEMGLRTIVISTDTAHSLADSLDAKIGPEPVPILDNLWAQEVDTRHSMDAIGRIQNHAGGAERQGRAGHRRGGGDDPARAGGRRAPAVDQQIRRGGQHDVLIVDAAPTAETLCLLSLPDTSRLVVPAHHGADARRRAHPAAAVQAADRRGPARHATLDSIDGLFTTLDKVRELLADPEHSSLRLVINPERMVIKETQRTYTYLNLYGYTVDAVLLNRVIPTP